MNANQIRIIIQDEAQRHGWTLVWSDMRMGAFRIKSAAGVVRLHEGGASMRKDSPASVRFAVYATIQSGRVLHHLCTPVSVEVAAGLLAQS